MTAPRGLEVAWLGRVPYAEALERQQKCVEARRAGTAGDTLLLLEHPPVITLGRRTDPAHLLAPREQLAARGIEVHEISRGGDVTWHGPGQLVGYAIVDLQARGAADVGAFLRLLEQGLIDALGTLGVPAGRRPGWTGVFAGADTASAAGPGAVAPTASGAASASAATARPRKIASIGIGIRHWITYHGFALNVDPDPDAFADIVPCGLHQVEMTSVARELGPAAPPHLPERARHAVRGAFTRLLA